MGTKNEYDMTVSEEYAGENSTARENMEMANLSAKRPQRTSPAKTYFPEKLLRAKRKHTAQF